MLCESDILNIELFTSDFASDGKKMDKAFFFMNFLLLNYFKLHFLTRYLMSFEKLLYHYTKDAVHDIIKVFNHLNLMYLLFREFYTFFFIINLFTHQLLSPTNQISYNYATTLDTVLC